LAGDSPALISPARGRKIQRGDQFFGLAGVTWLQSKRQHMVPVNARILVG
jgi:hypothetical protein